MITITPGAQEKLQTYLTENKVTPYVRVYLSDCGCSGGGDQLSLTIDEPAPDDLTVAVDAMKLFMSRDLYEKTGKINIDFKDDGQNFGFVVESEKPLPVSGASSCAGCSCCE